MNYHKIVQQMDEMEMAEFIASNEQVLIKEYMTTLFEAILGKKELPKESRFRQEGGADGRTGC